MERFTLLVSLYVTSLKPYLLGDPVDAAAPQHLAPLQLHLSVVDLVQVLHLLQLVLGDLLLLRAVTRRLQELQPLGGDTGHQLRPKHHTAVRHSSSTSCDLNMSLKVWRQFLFLMMMISCTEDQVIIYYSPCFISIFDHLSVRS